jgi:hypothetical protein
MRHLRIAFAFFGCTSAFLGCGTSDALPPPDAALYVGQETDAWLAAPQAQRVQVDLIALDGSRTALTTQPAPAPIQADATTPTIIPLPEQHYGAPTIGTFEATGLDGTGAPVLRGNSVYYIMDGIYAVRIPIFLGRVGTWARPPYSLEHQHVHPVVSTVYEMLIAAGGDPIAGVDPSVPDLYDAAAWQTLHNQPALPLAPKSMASVGTNVLTLNDSTATWLDLQTETTQPLATSAITLNFADVAGGETLEAPDGPRYIIGGTRQDGTPTDKVLVVDTQLAPTVLSLTTPRLGAAAGFVGTALVVAGGAPDGPMAEILKPGATAFTPLAFPTDPTAGLGLAALDGKTAIVAGGKDPQGVASSVRTFDITCTDACTTSELMFQLPSLTRTKVFALSPSQLLVVGEADDGTNHALLLDPTSSPPANPVEIELKEPRAKATPVLMPNGQVALVGGIRTSDAMPAMNLELFIP